MSVNNEISQGVPTNIITGFLGAGKTTAIMHLLENKPEHERWAILVNEFGEIGIDGSLIKGMHEEKQQVFIREVPGGCMCCAAGLPMQIALSLLLAEAKPDRLLIEPTGLGHPKEVMQVLLSDHYQQVLSLQKTLTLVDARKLSDHTYINHDIFNQQIAIADTLVGNKLDLYLNEEKDKLINYVKEHTGSETKVIFVEQGRISLSDLQGKTTANLPCEKIHSHGHKKQLASDISIPECGYVKATNEGEGFKSVGWRFAQNKLFSKAKLVSFLNSIDSVRMKAVFITDEGIFGYNSSEDAIIEVKLNSCEESRVELISENLDVAWDDKLLACLIS